MNNPPRTSHFWYHKEHGGGLDSNPPPILTLLKTDTKSIIIVHSYLDLFLSLTKLEEYLWQ